MIFIDSIEKTFLGLVNDLRHWVAFFLGCLVSFYYRGLNRIWSEYVYFFDGIIVILHMIVQRVCAGCSNSNSSVVYGRLQRTLMSRIW